MTSNQLVTILSVKKCREKTKAKRDGRLLWVYAVRIEGDERTLYSVLEPPLGQLNVNTNLLKAGLISRPRKQNKYA